MQDKRDFKKVICGIIYIIIVIVLSKYADILTKGKKLTVVGKLSDNIARIRISNISECYEESIITNSSNSKQKEMYVEKVYKKLIKQEVEETYVKSNTIVKNINTAPTNVNASDIVLPKFGQIFGKINIPKCSINTNIVFGLTQYLVDNYEVASQDCLTSVYVNPMLPGYGRPLLIAGHNYKSFSRLKNITVGSQITISTSYGVFYYTVVEAKTAKLNVHGTTIVDIDTGEDLIVYSGQEQLQMYTCESLDANDTHRFFVRAVKTGRNKNYILKYFIFC